MQVGMTQMPPLREPLGEIDLAPTTTQLTLTADTEGSVRQLLGGLRNLERMSFDCKRVVALQFFHRARTIKELHPVPINAGIIQRITFNLHVAIDVDGTLMMRHTATAAGGAPLTGVFGERPSDGFVKGIGPSQARLRVGTAHTNPVFGAVVVVIVCSNGRFVIETIILGRTIRAVVGNGRSREQDREGGSYSNAGHFDELKKL